MHAVASSIYLMVLTVVPILLQITAATAIRREKRDALQTLQGALSILAPSFTPTEVVDDSWSVHNRIPMTAEADRGVDRIGRMDLNGDINSLFSGRGKNKYYKKYKKYMLPLLLAYKLKFFTLIPVLIGGLVLLTGATGLAGFFFALFAATMGLKGGGDH